jgi:hypothetical protein
VPNGRHQSCTHASVPEAQLVSDALARAGINHRFEIYDDGGELSGYLHHEWPSKWSAE